MDEIDTSSRAGVLLSRFVGDATRWAADKTESLWGRRFQIASAGLATFKKGATGLVCSLACLTGLAKAQGAHNSVLAYNPTPFPRIQVVVFGIPKGKAPKGAEILMRLPTVDICTARVFVPALHNGYISVLSPALPTPRPKLGFSFSKTLTWAISDKVRSAAFKELAPIASNSQMIVRHLVGKDAQGMVGHLIVYQGAGEEWCRYEFILALESLGAAEKQVTAGITVTRPGGNLYMADRMLGSGMATWKGYKGGLRDRQGFGSFGSVIALPNRADDIVALSTKVAEATYEITSCGHFDKWGPWGTRATGRHLDRTITRDLFGHRGVILNRRPGGTGEQFGFGVYKHLDAQRPGQIHRLAHDRAAVLQASCRPMWLFDPSGEIAKTAWHPKFVSWDETWHWSKAISKDRFGRYYNHNGWYKGWTGMDRQHYSVVALSEDVLLRGGFMSQLILKMKGFHWLMERNYPTGGRAIGRFMFAAHNFWVATGDKRYAKTVRDRWLPAFKRDWAARNGHWVKLADLLTTAPVAMRLYKDDPHTKIPGLEWICWEDGIAIQGLDVLWPMINDPEVKLATYLLARSIVNHAFDKKGRIYKAIRWNGSRKALGPQLADSNQTNYSEWALPALAICARMANEFGDTQTSQRAIGLLTPLLKAGYKNIDSYLGPLGGR